MAKPPRMGTPGTVVDRGLEGIIVGATALSDVDGEAGRLTYRGYDIAELATQASFEEVAHLLLFGALPSIHQLGNFKVRLAASRTLPPTVLEWLSAMPLGAWPMDVLRTAISALALFTPHQSEGAHLSSPRSAIDLIAKTPTIVAAWDRIRRGLRPIDPLPSLSTAANFLYMRTGKMPHPDAERALDAYLIVLADHSLTASTFAARVTASTHADIFASTTTALAALGGELHGGASGAVMTMLLEIDTPARAQSYVRARVEQGEGVLGLGHREYRVRDPRAVPIEAAARDLSEVTNTRWFAVARALETAASSELAAAPQTSLYANVDFYAAPLLYALDIPPDEFTCLFACGRMAGWTAHVLEQRAANRLIRPQAAYRGPAPRPWSPLERRDTSRPSDDVR